MTVSHNLLVRFESDWHIGSGAGIPGSVDRQVLRDAEGLPFVPGKTITGILRDAAEMVVEVRDGGENGEGRWRRALVSLFGGQPEAHGGSPVAAASSAAIGFGDAVLSSGLRDRIAARAELAQALFFVQPGVKISRKSGRAEEDHLFSFEKVRAGCVLRAPVYKNRELAEEERILLEDAVKATRRMGADRRRGGGRCVLVLEEKAEASSYETTNPLSIPSEDCPHDVEFDLRLETLQPVLINIATAGNIVRSSSVIPGGTIFPLVFEALASKINADRLRRAAMQGALSVSSFVPEVAGQRGLPVPHVFSKPKESSGVEGVVNRLVQRGDERMQMKELRSGWMGTDKRGHVVFPGKDDETRLLLRTHNSIEDLRQRPTSAVGGVYTYQSIPRGRVLRGTLRFSSALWREIRNVFSEDDFRNALDREISIGQSKKDEYGRIRLRAEKANICTESGGVSLVKGLLVAYLASDVLVRDENLAYSGNPEDLKRILSKQLGVSLEWVTWTGETSPLGGDRGDGGRGGRAESWHTRWNLPRQSLVYLQAGGVYLFEVKGEWGPEEAVRAARMQEEGIGERIAEGFGRVMFNPDFLLLGKGAVSEGDSDASNKVSGVESRPLSAEDAEYLGMLTQEVVKRKFRRLARLKVYDEIGGRNFGIRSALPSASQIGALREAACTLSDGDGGFDAFRRWLAFPVGNVPDLWPDARREQWGMWRAWVRDLLELESDEKDVWATVGFSRSLASNDILREMRPFALRTFFDIFCEAVFDREKTRKNEEGRA